MKKKALKTLKINRRPLKMQNDLGEAASRFKAVFTKVNTLLIDRSSELDALMLAILSRRNMMLEGLHGTAKSMLANEVFSRITGSVVFEKQLTKGTQLDELFGPMRSKTYREEAVWTHNTTKMLPESHFVFVDEVYRASDMVLPSMLGVLNERTFMNGTVKMHCPLLCAIGTTNFVTQSEELEAFHDRWLIKAKILPIPNSSLRVKFLRLGTSIPDEEEEKVTVSLEDIIALQTAVLSVSFEETTLELYDEMVTDIRRRMSPFYISDRRLLQALKLAAAKAVLADPEAMSWIVSPDMLSATESGLVTLNDDKGKQAFGEAFTSSIGALEKVIEHDANLDLFESSLSRWLTGFDPSMKRSRAEDLYVTVKDALEGMRNASPEEIPNLPRQLKRWQAVMTKMDDLLMSIAPIVSVQFRKTSITPATQDGATFADPDSAMAATADDSDEDDAEHDDKPTPNKKTW